MDRKKMNECLVRTQNGDKAAYSLFYEEAAKGVFAFLYGYYKNYARTEEAMQETFYKALKNISQYRAGSDARAWLLQIAKNIALNDLNRAKREEWLPEENFEPLLTENPPDGTVCWTIRNGGLWYCTFYGGINTAKLLKSWQCLSAP